MNGFWILYGVCGLFLSGYLGFSLYAKLIGKRFFLSFGKGVVCFGASVLLMLLERTVHLRWMLLSGHPLFGALGMLLFAVLFACFFAGITVKKEEARLKKRKAKIVVSHTMSKKLTQKAG